MLKTEMRNPNTTNIDKMSTIEMLRTMNNENKKVTDAIEDVLENVAIVVDKVALAFSQGGRLIYIGAGTSGRLGIIDAAECPPTFGVSSEQVIGIIAGGEKSLIKAAEAQEDSFETGQSDVSAVNINEKDVLIGISASGYAAYVLGAIEKAKSVGAFTVGLTCNIGTDIANFSDIAISPDTGAEAITGSTRLKAGTAQKLILNLISTGAMIKTNKVYENLMINVRPVNKKLLDRCIRIICEITKVDYKIAQMELKNANNSIRSAIDNINKECQK